MQEIVVNINEANQRMDKFLVKKLPNTTKGFLYKMLRKKSITLNGKKAEGSEILKTADQIQFFFSEETFQKFCISPIAADKQEAEYRKAYQQLQKQYKISIVLETENVIILNKPAGVLSQKSEEKDLSINEWLIGYLLEKNQITGKELETFHPSVCNRLDRNTSGLLICSKTMVGSQVMCELIKERKVRKFYRTVVKGNLEEAIILEGYLKKDERTNKVTIYTEPFEDSDYIKTAYQPIKSTSEYSVLEVELFTGKTHQIRAHLSSIKHPIAGDMKYGDITFNDYLKQTYGIKYQLLHAYRLEFPKITGYCTELSEKIVIADLPKQFSYFDN